MKSWWFKVYHCQKQRIQKPRGTKISPNDQFQWLEEDWSIRKSSNLVQKVPSPQGRKEKCILHCLVPLSLLKAFCALVPLRSIKIKKNQARIHHWDRVFSLLHYNQATTRLHTLMDSASFNTGGKNPAYLVSIFCKLLASIYTRGWIWLRIPLCQFLSIYLPWEREFFPRESLSAGVE